MAQSPHMAPSSMSSNHRPSTKVVLPSIPDLKQSLSSLSLAFSCRACSVVANNDRRCMMVSTECGHFFCSKCWRTSNTASDDISCSCPVCGRNVQKADFGDIYFPPPFKVVHEEAKGPDSRVDGNAVRKEEVGVGRLMHSIQQLLALQTTKGKQKQKRGGRQLPVDSNQGERDFKMETSNAKVSTPLNSLDDACCIDGSKTDSNKKRKTSTESKCENRAQQPSILYKNDDGCQVTSNEIADVPTRHEDLDFSNTVTNSGPVPLTTQQVGKLGIKACERVGKNVLSLNTNGAYKTGMTNQNLKPEERPEKVVPGPETNSSNIAISPTALPYFSVQYRNASGGRVMYGTSRGRRRPRKPVSAQDAKSRAFFLASPTVPAQSTSPLVDTGDSTINAKERSKRHVGSMSDARGSSDMFTFHSESSMPDDNDQLLPRKVEDDSLSADNDKKVQTPSNKNEKTLQSTLDMNGAEVDMEENDETMDSFRSADLLESYRTKPVRRLLRENIEQDIFAKATTGETKATDLSLDTKQVMVCQNSNKPPHQEQQSENKTSYDTATHKQTEGVNLLHSPLFLKSDNNLCRRLESAFDRQSLAPDERCEVVFKPNELNIGKGVNVQQTVLKGGDNFVSFVPHKSGEDMTIEGSQSDSAMSKSRCQSKDIRLGYSKDLLPLQRLQLGEVSFFQRERIPLASQVYCPSQEPLQSENPFRSCIEELSPPESETYHLTPSSQMNYVELPLQLHQPSPEYLLSQESLSSEHPPPTLTCLEKDKEVGELSPSETETYYPSPPSSADNSYRHESEQQNCDFAESSPNSLEFHIRYLENGTQMSNIELSQRMDQDRKSVNVSCTGTFDITTLDCDASKAPQHPNNEKHVESTEQSFEGSEISTVLLDCSEMTDSGKKSTLDCDKICTGKKANGMSQQSDCCSESSSSEVQETCLPAIGMFDHSEFSPTFIRHRAAALQRSHSPINLERKSQSGSSRPETTTSKQRTPIGSDDESSVVDETELLPFKREVPTSFQTKELLADSLYLNEPSQVATNYDDDSDCEPDGRPQPQSLMSILSSEGTAMPFKDNSVRETDGFCSQKESFDFAGMTNELDERMAQFQHQGKRYATEWNDEDGEKVRKANIQRLTDKQLVHLGDNDLALATPNVAKHSFGSASTSSVTRLSQSPVRSVSVRHHTSLVSSTSAKITPVAAFKPFLSERSPVRSLNVAPSAAERVVRRSVDWPHVQYVLAYDVITSTELSCLRRLLDAKACVSLKDILSVNSYKHGSVFSFPDRALTAGENVRFVTHGCDLPLICKHYQKSTASIRVCARSFEYLKARALGVFVLDARWLIASDRETKWSREVQYRIWGDMDLYRMLSSLSISRDNSLSWLSPLLLESFEQQRLRNVVSLSEFSVLVLPQSASTIDDNCESSTSLSNNTPEPNSFALNEIDKNELNTFGHCSDSMTQLKPTQIELLIQLLGGNLAGQDGGWKEAPPALGMNRLIIVPDKMWHNDMMHLLICYGTNPNSIIPSNAKITRFTGKKVAGSEVTNRVPIVRGSWLADSISANLLAPIQNYCCGFVEW